MQITSAKLINPTAIQNTSPNGRPQHNTFCPGCSNGHMQMTGRKEYEFAPVWNNVPCPPYRYENDSYWVTLTHPCESQILKAPPGDGKTGTKFKRTRTRVR